MLAKVKRITEAFINARYQQCFLIRTPYVNTFIIYCSMIKEKVNSNCVLLKVIYSLGEVNLFLPLIAEIIYLFKAI